MCECKVYTTHRLPEVLEMSEFMIQRRNISGNYLQSTYTYDFLVTYIFKEFFVFSLVTNTLYLLIILKNQ